MEAYKVVVYLVNGKRLKVYGRVTAEELDKVYKALGVVEGRFKIPTSRTTTQLVPTSSVLRVVAKGVFS